MIGAQGAPVLLVGEIGSRLESMLAMSGLACSKAQNANDAVAVMKTRRFPLVVVPPKLTDMSGVDFIQGVLRHFDATVVLYGSGVDLNEIGALLRTGRVAHFGEGHDGRAVAEFVKQRVSASSTPPISTPPSSAPHSASTRLSGVAVPPGANGNGSTTTGNFGPASGFGAVATTGLTAALFGGQVRTPARGTSGPMPRSPGPGVATDPRRLEAMAEELARSNAELTLMRQRMQQAEQEKQSLLAEVEAARKNTLSSVAEVMALSDEGDPITEEIEELKAKIASLESDHQQAREEADALRAARDELIAQAAATTAQLAEARGRAEATEGILREAQATILKQRDEVADWKAKGDKLNGELESTNAALAATQQELESARAAGNGTSDVEAALRTELEKVRSDVTAARGEATAVRLDLQEALMRLEEATNASLAAVQERDALRDEAGPLREWANQLVSEHAWQQGELERLRLLVEQSAAQLEALDARRAQLRELKEGDSGDHDDEDSNEDEAKSKSSGLDEAEVMERARHLASLVGALEPFMWGLGQATTFYAKKKVDGGDAHLKLLQQLQGVLLRLRDEIAMLDMT